MKYAGIGSRKTPEDILKFMMELALILDQCKLTLRSGGAIGADMAFEKNSTSKEIFTINSFIPDEAFRIVSELHPKFDKLSKIVKRLHARNMMQILGQNLDDPVKFVVCWTPDGAKTVEDCSIKTGGTATAIKLADINKIPVYNLKNKNDLTFWKTFVISKTMENLFN